MSLLSLSQSLIDAFELRVLLDLGDGAVERGAVALVLPVGPILSRFIGVSHQPPPLSLMARNVRNIRLIALIASTLEAFVKIAGAATNVSAANGLCVNGVGSIRFLRLKLYSALVHSM